MWISLKNPEVSSKSTSENLLIKKKVIHKKKLKKSYPMDIHSHSHLLERFIHKIKNGSAFQFLDDPGHHDADLRFGAKVFGYFLMGMDYGAMIAAAEHQTNFWQRGFGHFTA